MPNHPKEVCVNCHFFSKKTPDPANDLERSISEEDRGRLMTNVLSLTDNVLLGCQMKVWSAVHPPDKTKLTEEIFTTRRKDVCFYWPYRRGMAFPAAQILQKREAENRDAAHDRKLVIYGLWIAAIATAVQALPIVVQAFWAVIGLVISWYKS
jgi:hypothetical protein